MAITTIDGIIAGAKPPKPYYKALSGALVAGRPFSPFYTPGIPGRAVAPSPGIAGAALTSYPGQISFPTIASGKRYLSRFLGQATINGTLLLCDRLWHNSGITITSATAQTINSVAWPARDANAATSGEDVLIGLEVSSVTGAGTPTLTLSYTNSAGTAGKTGVNTVATSASSAVGAFFPIGLAAGDVGVQSIQTYTQSATWTSGTVHLVAYRILAALELNNANTGNAIDALTGGFPELFANTVPFLLFIPSTTTTSNIFAEVSYADG